MFAGQYWDKETGLHYNRHRYYDPSIGRYISKDPIGLAGGINVYAYVENPTGWIDPLGLAASGAEGVIKGPNIPGGEQVGLSTGAGGAGIQNPAVQAVYDNVPADQRSPFHGKCAEADNLSKAANTAGVKTVSQLSDMVKGAASRVWSRATGKKKPACLSCAHVQKQLGVQDECGGQ